MDDEEEADAPPTVTDGAVMILGTVFEDEDVDADIVLGA